MPNRAETQRMIDASLNSTLASTIDTSHGTVVLTDDATLTSTDSGKTIVCNAADIVVTLPATAMGLKYRILTNVASSGTGTSVSPNAADKINGNGFTAADNKDAINSGATDAVGDYIDIEADAEGTGWWITGAKGTWAREG